MVQQYKKKNGSSIAYAPYGSKVIHTHDSLFKSDIFRLHGQKKTRHNLLLN